MRIHGGDKFPPPFLEEKEGISVENAAGSRVEIKKIF
jgi:hypothetical protein